MDAPAPRNKIYGSAPEIFLETMLLAKALIESDIWSTAILFTTQKSNENTTFKMLRFLTVP
ncbi:hypothetical protein DU64_13655 [Methanosarcina mazei]|uniref:Uncharacterized protein n=1 Tax=Methanosarcina mazei TaxID=2209 RepID=A0A0F8FZ42_METMZ|nr:hypothetical protein DU33_09635 [Methanosarcina mazei]KKG58402.1 hypothetical protein DU45_06525 [Methanosarcina mazei]KKG60579.1 hypothetical protein DU64_13655 [Methanosarcina mazei]